MKWAYLIPGLIAATALSFTLPGRGVSSNPPELRYFIYLGDLMELVPKGEVRMTNNALIFSNGYTMKSLSQAAKDTMFPDSTGSKDRIFRNDSFVKKAAYVPVSRNRWYLCNVETLISGSSGQSMHDGSSGTVTYMFSRIDKPTAGLVQIKGTNICFILPP